MVRLFSYASYLPVHDGSFVHGCLYSVWNTFMHGCLYSVWNTATLLRYLHDWMILWQTYFLMETYTGSFCFYFYYWSPFNLSDWVYLGYEKTVKRCLGQLLDTLNVGVVISLYKGVHKVYNTKYKLCTATPFMYSLTPSLNLNYDLRYKIKLRLRLQPTNWGCGRGFMKM
jgi:hypothetical protein